YFAVREAGIALRKSRRRRERGILKSRMSLIDSRIDDPDLDSGSGVRGSANGAPRVRRMHQAHRRIEVAPHRRQVLHENHPGAVLELDRDFPGGVHEYGIDQNLLRRHRTYPAARQLRQNAALGLANTLEISFRRPTYLSSYGRVCEDQRIIR